MAAHRGALPHPIAKPVRDRAKRTEVNQARVPVRAKWAVEIVLLPEVVVAIASGIAAFHQAPTRGQAATPWAEDPAEGAAVPRVPAVRAVVPVWALAVVADHAAVAAEGGGRQVMHEDKQMNAIKSITFTPKIPPCLWALALSCALTLIFAPVVFSRAKTPQASPQTQKTFDSPKAAAEALIRATETDDVAALKEIFGAAGENLVESEDAVQDKNISTEFAAKAHQKNSINVDPKNPNRAILVVGNNNWPMPIPIVKRNGKWLFDTKAGRQEMLLSAHRFERTRCHPDLPRLCGRPTTICLGEA